ASCDRPSRVSHDLPTGGYVPGDHRTRTDQRAGADPNSRQEKDPGADHGASFHEHSFEVALGVGPIRIARVDDHHIGPEPRIVLDDGLLPDEAARVESDTIADLHTRGETSAASDRDVGSDDASLANQGVMAEGAAVAEGGACVDDGVAPDEAVVTEDHRAAFLPVLPDDRH